MKFNELIDNIMNKLNFNELEIRENNAGCDFKGTLDHYRNMIKDSVKENAEYFNEEGEEFDISDTSIKDIIKEIQERIDNDYSCEE